MSSLVTRVRLKQIEQLLEKGKRLEDIRWKVGEIVIRGKGRVYDRLPLLDDVGEALVLYLREARGPSASRHVFLRQRAPRVGLSRPSAVCEVARQALRRAGLRPAGRAAAHIFRHSLATRMIRGGASLEEISQMLRQPVQIGTQLASRTRFCLARRSRLHLQLSSQFLHQLRQYFLGFSLHWTPSFRPLRFLFLLHGRLAILLQGSISLSFGIALRVL